jgi:3-oxoadipate enol-lactonase
MLSHRFDGPPDAPLLVLGPALGTTMAVWEPQLRALTESWHVLRYDLPGHGSSDPVPVESVDDLADEVGALIDGPVAYAGISLGGAIGLTLALRGRVSELVVCCSSARFGTVEGWRERAALVRADGLMPLAGLLISRWFTAGYRGPGIGRVLEMLPSVAPESYAACCEALATFDLAPRLGSVPVPVGVVAGADDPATPVADAELLAREIPDASLTVLPDCSHLANLERPSVVTPAIVEQLERTTWRTMTE